jgi:hypothetical protein
MNVGAAVLGDAERPEILCPELSRVERRTRDASRHEFTGLSRVSRVVPSQKQQGQSANAGRSRRREELAVLAAGVGAPRREAVLFLVQVISEIDVRLAIQQIAQIQSRSPQMNGIDLEISPIESSVGVVVIDLALALRIFRPLNGQCDATIGAEFPARILLPRGQPTTMLIRPSLFGIQRVDSLFDNQRPLEVHPNRALQADGVIASKPQQKQAENRRGNDRSDDPCRSTRW